jgi:hypothetical protein
MEMEDKIMFGVLPNQIYYENRPLHSLDLLFEKRMKTRLSKIHANLYDRITYDDSLLNK